MVGKAISLQKLKVCKHDQTKGLRKTASFHDDLPIYILTLFILLFIIGIRDEEEALLKKVAFMQSLTSTLTPMVNILASILTFIGFRYCLFMHRSCKTRHFLSLIERLKNFSV